MEFPKHLLLIVCAIFAMGCNGKKAAEKKAIVSRDSIARVTKTNDSLLGLQINEALVKYPGISAQVSQHEIVLQGAVVRDRLPVLLESIHELDERRINQKKLSVYP